MSETVVVKKKSGAVSFLALFIAFAGLGLAAYIYYTETLYKSSLNKHLNQIEAQISAENQANNAVTKQLRDDINKLDTKYSRFTNANNENILFQINELISLANQGLVVYNDIPGAIHLLNRAKEMLDSNNDAMFTGIKYALSADLAKLNQLTGIDKTMLSGELDSLALNVAALQLEQQTDQPSIAAEDKSKWSMFVENFKNSLLGLVSISKPDSEANVLLPGHDSVMQQNIRLDLLNARMALLQHDQKSWIYGLHNAQTLLNTYFTGYRGVDKISSQLAELMRIDVSNPGVNIDATVAQLIKLNNLK